MKQLTLIFLISHSFFIETYSQQPKGKTSIFFDFSPYTRGISQQVVEEVRNSPFPYNAQVVPSISAEITALRRYSQWAFGIGISSFSSKLNLNVNFPPPADPEGDFFRQPTEIYAQFSRFYSGLHLCALWTKGNTSIGLRTGFYLIMSQNSIDDNYEINRRRTDTDVGFYQTRLLAYGGRHDSMAMRNTLELEWLQQILPQFWLGLHLNYLHNRKAIPLYTYNLKQHQEWQPIGSSVEAPVVNDITVYEPLFQLGANLRYELKCKKKGEDDLTQP